MDVFDKMDVRSLSTATCRQKTPQTNGIGVPCRSAVPHELWCILRGDLLEHQVAINSFQGLAGDGGGGLGAVAGGISEALVATAVGLMVAIPAVFAFNMFNGRVQALIIDMNDVASELVDYVLKEGRY